MSSSNLMGELNILPPSAFVEEFAISRCYIVWQAVKLVVCWHALFSDFSMAATQHLLLAIDQEDCPRHGAVLPFGLSQSLNNGKLCHPLWEFRAVLSQAIFLLFNTLVSIFRNLVRMDQTVMAAADAYVLQPSG